MKIKTIFLAGTILAAMAFISCDDDDDEVDNSTNAADTNFMLQTSISNSSEISLGTLAATKATNARVKSFAQQMVAEHTTAQADLRTLGTSVSYNVTDSIDPAHVTIRTQLNALTGRAFDSVYIWGQVADHQATLTNFQTEQNSGRQTSVVAYANTNLPKIQQHFTTADSIARAYFRR